MPTTDDQVATLHALLAGRREEHRQLLNQLDLPSANTGYSALLAAGLFEAVERRFIIDGKVVDSAEVVSFVASVRERGDEMPDLINPEIAERIIFRMLDQGEPVSNVDADTIVRHQIILLAGLIGDANLSESELSEFMQKIRVDADELLD
ncbi:hypothetical protein ACLQ2P_17415 [Actinomadura citrea]|uniref:hypothetical protein n=1 Tax=Actinomadura citrea TaxID=46158 RepID=UPI003CE4AA6E